MSKILLSIAALAVSAAAMEAGLRLVPRFRLDAMAVNVFRFSDRDMKLHYRPSSILGYELVPGSSPEINSLGMRDREYAERKNSGTFRVLLLGDSVTQMGRWSDFAEEKLNAGGENFELLNCGVCGWGLNQYWSYLEHYGLRYGADMAVIGFCLNDIEEYSQTGMILSGGKNGLVERFTPVVRFGGKNARIMDVNPYLFKYSCLYRAVVSGFLVARDKYVITESQSPLAMLSDIRRFSGGKVLGIIFPYIKPLGEYDALQMKQYKMTRALLGKAGIEYLDLTGSFARYGKDIVRFRSLPEDCIHFNDEGSRIIADNVLEWIKSGRLRFS